MIICCISRQSQSFNSLIWNKIKHRMSISRCTIPLSSGKHGAYLTQTRGAYQNDSRRMHYMTLAKRILCIHSSTLSQWFIHTHRQTLSLSLSQTPNPLYRFLQQSHHCQFPLLTGVGLDWRRFQLWRLYLINQNVSVCFMKRKCRISVHCLTRAHKSRSRMGSQAFLFRKFLFINAWEGKKIPLEWKQRCFLWIDMFLFVLSDQSILLWNNTEQQFVDVGVRDKIYTLYTYNETDYNFGGVFSLK